MMAYVLIRQSVQSAGVNYPDPKSVILLRVATFLEMMLPAPSRTGRSSSFKSVEVCKVLG
jgi:hypothetical protein